ncbi:MAG: DUF11 domain-containing protein, partial [Caldilineaceae bacterium]|nr:DUF11 domain-containing protein [Caldilineaceae bacterium]
MVAASGGYTDVMVVGGSFNENEAASSGGGLYSGSGDGGVLFITGTTFISNTASVGGGFSTNDSLDASNVILIGNYATSYGGALESGGESSTLRGALLFDNLAEFDGGGICLIDGDLTIRTARSSAILPSPATGGGVWSDASLYLQGSTVVENAALSGGGIFNSGTFTATNSTISGNQADADGGGVLESGFYGETTYLYHTTVTENSADGDGGGVANDEGAVFLYNAIIADNIDTTPITEQPDVSGDFTSNGYNLIGIGDGSSGLVDGVGGDQVGTLAEPIDAKLASLADNGGETETHALLAGSPAIDAGSCVDAPPTDQRGATRPNAISAFCDIGAYESEFAADSDVAIAKSVSTDQAQPGDTITYTLVFTNNGPSVAQNVVISDVIPGAVEVIDVVTGGVAL